MPALQDKFEFNVTPAGCLPLCPPRLSQGKDGGDEVEEQLSASRAKLFDALERAKHIQHEHLTSMISGEKRNNRVVTSKRARIWGGFGGDFGRDWGG